MGALDRGLVFLDCITREDDSQRVIKMLRPHVHGSIIAMHDSKYTSDKIKRTLADNGLTLSTPRVVFKTV